MIRSTQHWEWCAALAQVPANEASAAAEAVKKHSQALQQDYGALEQQLEVSMGQKKEALPDQVLNLESALRLLTLLLTLPHGVLKHSHTVSGALRALYTNFCQWETLPWRFWQGAGKKLVESTVQCCASPGEADHGVSSLLQIDLRVLRGRFRHMSTFSTECIKTEKCNAGLVETSTNLASVKQDSSSGEGVPTAYKINCSTRSSLSPAMDSVRDSIARLSCLVSVFLGNSFLTFFDRWVSEQPQVVSSIMLGG